MSDLTANGIGNIPYTIIQNAIDKSGVLTPEQKLAARKASLVDLDNPNRIDMPTGGTINPVDTAKGLPPDLVQNPLRNLSQEDQDRRNMILYGQKPEDSESGVLGSKAFEGVQVPMQGLPDKNGQYPVVAVGGPTGFYYNQQAMATPKQTPMPATNIASQPTKTASVPTALMPVQMAPAVSQPQAPIAPSAPIKDASIPEAQISKVTSYLKNTDDVKLGDILDMLGVSLSAAGGTQRKTHLQQQAEANIQKQLISKQGQTQMEVAKNQGDIDLQNKLKTIDPQTDAQIRAAIAAGNNEAANQILVSRGTLPDDIKKIMASYQAQLAMSMGANPMMAGYNAAKSKQ